MPQMAPLSWLTLFFFFLIIFLLFNLINFFIFTYTPNQKTIKKNPLNFYWKW